MFFIVGSALAERLLSLFTKFIVKVDQVFTNKHL